MTTARTRSTQRFAAAIGAAVMVFGMATTTPAMQLDDRGEMRLGLRAYTAVRIGTGQQGNDNPGVALSYPVSPAGHVRQHRYFLQLKFDHDLKRIASQYGWAWLLGGWMKPDDFSYSLQYRGEGEGIYDYGPDEFSDQKADLENFRLDSPNIAALGQTNRLDPEFIRQRLSKLRRISRIRHRFFAGYLDFTKGPVQLRIGRQVLAWGETDIFRLLDNINPADASFGGFLLSLDERRVPIDMIRASYRFDSVGPISDAFLEGFVAEGNRISQFPGTPGGAEWQPAGIGRPNPVLKQDVRVPDMEDVRGGARLVFNALDATWSVAHYYTYMDIPGTRFRLPGKPANAISSAPNFTNPIIASAISPRVPITGASVTFPVASLYSIVRSEFAYVYGEPMSRQGKGDGRDSAFGPGTPQWRRLVAANNIEGGVDPFVYPGFLNVIGDGARVRPFTGRLLQRDTINFAVGFDVNRFIRFLNPSQTIFASTQVFYKHILDSPGDIVLPTPFKNIGVSTQKPKAGDPIGYNVIMTGCGKKGQQLQGRPCLVRPRLSHVNDNQFLHTLLLSTSYFGGQVVPSVGMFYDWQGAWVFQPGVVLSRDPFRFLIDYSYISGNPTGQLGTLRDRDNIRFQAEFVF